MTMTKGLNVRKFLALLVSLLFIPTLASAFTLSGNTLTSNDNTYFDWGSEYAYLTDFDTTWPDDAYVQLLLEDAANRDGNEFGIYGFSLVDGNVVLGDKLMIFDGPSDPGAGVKLLWDTSTHVTNLDTGMSANIGTRFGFYLHNDAEGTFYSHVALNDGLDYFRIFNVSDPYSSDLGDNDTIIAIEDLNGTGDGDYNDMVVGTDDILPAPAPEPSTLLLFGIGIVALGCYRRYRKA